MPPPLHLMYVRAETKEATMGDILPEEAAKWHDRQAELAMGSLHCGSPNWEYREANRLADMHMMAAEAIRAIATQGARTPA